MALLPQSLPTQTGATPTYTAANAGGDTFAPGDNVFLNIVNTGGSPITVTVTSRRNCDQGFEHDAVVTVPATTGNKILGPFPTSRFGDPATGYAAVTYGATPTGVTVAVLVGHS